jgi:hypothetical protein
LLWRWWWWCGGGGEGRGGGKPNNTTENLLPIRSSATGSELNDHKTRAKKEAINLQPRLVSLILPIYILPAVQAEWQLDPLKECYKNLIICVSGDEMAYLCALNPSGCDPSWGMSANVINSWANIII